MKKKITLLATMVALCIISLAVVGGQAFFQAYAFESNNTETGRTSMSIDQRVRYRESGYDFADVSSYRDNCA